MGFVYEYFLQRWWMDLYEDVKVTYSRDRAVEIYLWAFGMFPGEENSSARIIMSKMIALVRVHNG